LIFLKGNQWISKTVTKARSSRARRLPTSTKDYGGTINIDGVEYWLSAWLKDGKSRKYMSLSVRPKE
jgi:hypothetical protein